MPKILVTILEIIAAVGVFMMIIALIYLGYHKAENVTSKGYKKLDTLETQLDESDYTKYDGAIVSGSDVIAAIKYFMNGDPVCVTVVARNTYSYCYTDTSLTTPSTESISMAQQRDNDHYINPNGKFLGEVIRDPADNSIVGITFTIQTK